MTGKTDNIALCAPVAPVGGLTFDPKAAPYSRYEKISCPTCGEAMWIGERCARLVRIGLAKPMCMPCAAKRGLVDPPIPLTDYDP